MNRKFQAHGLIIMEMNDDGDEIADIAQVVCEYPTQEDYDEADMLASAPELIDGVQQLLDGIKKQDKQKVDSAILKLRMKLKELDMLPDDEEEIKAL